MLFHLGVTRTLVLALELTVWQVKTFSISDTSACEFCLNFIDARDDAISLRNTAEQLRKSGKLAEAEQVYRQAVKAAEIGIAPNDPWTASLLEDLADICRQHEQLEDAELFYTRSISILIAVGGVNDVRLIKPMTALIGLHVNQRRFKEVEHLYKALISLAENAYGTDDPYVASIISALARVYYTTDRFADAEPLYLRALQIIEKNNPADHSSIFTNTYWLAEIYLKQERRDRAKPLVGRLRAIADETQNQQFAAMTEKLESLLPDLSTTVLYIKEKIAENPRSGICPAAYNIFSREGREYLRTNRYLSTEIDLDQAGNIVYRYTKRCGETGERTCNHAVRFNIRQIETIEEGASLDVRFECQSYVRCIRETGARSDRVRSSVGICAYNKDGLIKAFRQYQRLMGGFQRKREPF